MLAIGVVLIASLQLLLLLVYAAIGGALYERRLELGFEPRISPERAAERVEAERLARRQQFIDGLYKDLRVREAPRAVAERAAMAGRRTARASWLAMCMPSSRPAAAGRNCATIRACCRVC